MRHYGLIGEKLGHSLSQPIHEAIFREMGIDADYRIIEIPRKDFAPRTQELLAVLDGFNVTIPYKQDVMPLLDAIDPDAAGNVAEMVYYSEGNTLCMGYSWDSEMMLIMWSIEGDIMTQIILPELSMLQLTRVDG